MSLAINIDTIRSVLLGGKWIDIAPGSFDLDAFEFYHQEVMIHGGGTGGTFATGFRFILAAAPERIATADGEVFGPLTAIQALSTIAMEGE